MQYERSDVNKTPAERVFPARFLFAVCLFAFVLRLVLVVATASYRVVEDDTAHFGFGWEMGRVADSLAEGHGFASPLPLPTGPTAIVGPVYPLLMALVFRFFGIYSTASSVAVHVLQCAFAALTCLFIYLAGRDSTGEAAGKLAAIAWALFPLNIFFTVNKIWETSLTGMLAAVLFWLLLPLRRSTSIGRWAATGAVLGLAAMVNTSLVVLVVPFGLAALAANRMRGLRAALVGAVACLAVVSPWMIRNRIVFGKFMLRSNFPLEFRVGNNELSWGQKIEALHPSNNPAINVHWQQVGEPAFMAEESTANSAFVHEHFGRFAFSTMNRIVNYWTAAWIRPIEGYPNEWTVILPTALLTVLGFLGIRRLFIAGNPDASMFAGCLALYPVAYYLTTSQPRFYHSVTPFLVLAACYWVIDSNTRIQMQRKARELVGVSAPDHKETV